MFKHTWPASHFEALVISQGRGEMVVADAGVSDFDHIGLRGLQELCCIFL